MIVGFILCGLAIVHAIFDGSTNRIQRLLLLATLFIYGIFLEVIGIISGHHFYATEPIMIFRMVPLSIPLAWVGIIYSAMIISESLKLNVWMRIFTVTLIALSLDWGMEPIAVELGLWTWTYVGGSFFGIPSFNFIGWFIIPIAYQISYNLDWNKEKKRVQLLSIITIDNNDSLSRKIYTILAVVPLALVLMISMGLITLIPIVYNLPLNVVLIFESVTSSFVTFIIVFKRQNLKRMYWYDLIPGIILLYMTYSYVLLGFISGQIILGVHLIITGIPLLLVFIFNLFKFQQNRGIS
ncbi:MAG: carotenoid biosynthesis protein [Candidatus Hodarchaeota archaeon]